MVKCKHCRSRPATPGRTRCEVCIVKDREGKRAKRLEKRAAKKQFADLTFDIDVVDSPGSDEFADEPKTDPHGIDMSALLAAVKQKGPVGQLEKVLFVPDSHIPYHDAEAFALMLKAASVFKPDTIVILGDFCDFYAVSAHDKDPTRAQNLEWEVEQVKLALDLLDRVGASKKYYVEGNHENRLERYLMTRAPELFNMVKVRQLLQLHERGWSFIPYKQQLRLGKLHITHDLERAGQNAHRQAIDDMGQRNIVIGHVHRMAYEVRGDVDGGRHVGAALGWLGDFDKVDYRHKSRAMREWVHGFGVGYLEPSGNFHLQPVPIIDGKVVIAGQLVSL